MSKHRSYFLWVHWSALSSGGLNLIGRLGVEVLPDGVVVYGSTHGDKQVPDGVSKWNDAVTFEKDHSQTVTRSAHQQLAQAWLLRLEDREELRTGNKSKDVCMITWIIQCSKKRLVRSEFSVEYITGCNIIIYFLSQVPASNFQLKDLETFLNINIFLKLNNKKNNDIPFSSDCVLKRNFSLFSSLNSSRHLNRITFHTECI